MTQDSYHVDETKQEVVQQFALDPRQPLQLSVSNVHGRIFIRATERGDVWVQATKHGRRGSRAYDRASLRIEADDNVISINPEYGSGGFNSEGFDIDIGLDLGRDIARDVVKGLFGKRSDHERVPESADHEESEMRSGRPRYDIVVEVPRSLAPGSRISTRTTSGQTRCADLAARL
ncbi:MAG TPA: hypothetical protein VGR16_13255, partial [Thermomicrobiales bacterium]|nr:hypothetical protein [Thermomicrobiales bacterium]